MKIAFSLVLFAFMSSFANGQRTAVKQNTVTGIVSVASGKKVTQNSNAKRAFVNFKDTQNKRYSIYTDDNGEYKINLHPGTYEVYAVKDRGCVFCIEYFNNEFVVPENETIKLHIVLRFIGEG